jgi:hypothetical protein
MINIIRKKGVSTVRNYGRIATGIAVGALLALINLGCAARQPEIRDTWTSAAQQASSAASRAETAAGRAETAASRAETAAARVEEAAKRAENAAARVEAMVAKAMRK